MSVRTANLLELIDGVTGTSASATNEIPGPVVCADDPNEPLQPPRVFSVGHGPSVGADEPAQESDRRLKTDFRRVGSTVFGLPLYDFRYIGGREVYRGLMAQDVLSVMPDAVVTGSDGFMRVRYGMLGVSMQRVA